MKKFPNNLISFYRTDRLILIIYPSLFFQKKGKRRKRGNVGKVSSSSHAKLDRRKIITLKVGKGTRREKERSQAYMPEHLMSFKISQRGHG